MSSSSSRPTSVRGLYTPPSEEWVFLPPTVQPPTSTSPPTPTHLPTSFSLPQDTEDVQSMVGPIQLFAAEWFTTALGMPFEVGKTLLQVEYRPRKRFDTLTDVEEPVEEKDKLYEDELSNPEEAELYFSDRLSAPTTSFIPPPPPVASSSGYLPDLHPSWMLNDDPDIARGNGVWSTIRRLRYTPTEGLPALWKTQLISTFHSILSNLLQPHIHSFLLLAIPSSSTSPSLSLGLGTPDLPLTALERPALPLGLQVASHLLTHLVLSPLELLRTRMIVMPTSHPSTPSSVSLFRSIIASEGGFSSLYLHSNLLLPAILEHTLRPLLTLSIPLLLERQFNISPDLSPITYSLCDLSLGLGSLLVLLPIETVRKRLQLQSRARSAGAGAMEAGKKSIPGQKRDMKSIVRLRDTDYVGIVEAIWRIVTEETGAQRKRNMTEQDEGGVLSGIRQLYRGFGMAATAHLTVFGLGLVSAGLGGRGFEGGWKEI